MKLNVTWSDDNEAYIARADDHPGLIAKGGTPDEAMDKLRPAIKEREEFDVNQAVLESFTGIEIKITLRITDD